MSSDPPERSADAAPGAVGEGDPGGRPTEGGAGLAGREDHELRIEHLSLSRPTLNVLGRAGLLALTDITRQKASELQAIPGMGVKKLTEVTEKLAEHGLAPRPELASVHSLLPRSAARPRTASPRDAARGTPGTPRGVAAPRPRSSRDVEIITLRRDGLTLDQIGRRFGITRERVRQILRAGGVAIESAAATRRAQRLEAARGVSAELVAGFRAGRQTNDLARALGVSSPAAHEVIRASVTQADRVERRRRLSGNRTNDHLYTVADLTRAVREVSERIGGVPSSKDYADHAPLLGLPSLPTLSNRFGGWGEAVRAAGMVPHRSNRPNYTRRWTEERCWEALKNLVAELGEAPTAQQYEVLASADDELPSLATVRIRLGRWADVAARLVATPHSQPTLRRLGVSAETGGAERDEAVWLAHLAGDVSDAEICALLRADLFTWHSSYGPRPDV